MGSARNTQHRVGERSKKEGFINDKSSDNRPLLTLWESWLDLCRGVCGDSGFKGWGAC